MIRKNFLFLAFLASSVYTTPLYPHSIKEEEHHQLLKNAVQVTTEAMGFEKAGEAYFSPDSQKIIFQAVPKGKKQFQIYLMDLEERVPIMVSTGKGACTCANFRADGEKIIFASSHLSPDLTSENDQQKSKDGKYKWDLTPYMNIFEANLDGSELIPLTTGSAYHAECSYSTDGTKIVYASNESGSMNLYTMNSDGSNVQQITYTDNCYNGGPFFFPNGKSVLFRADRDKPNYLQVYKIDLETGVEKQLTNNEAVNWAPYPHPNGDIIAYTTSIHGHHRYEIYLMNIQTHKEVRLTYNPSFDGLPVFNSSGDKILWTSKRDGQTSQIFIANFSLPGELYEKS